MLPLSAVMEFEDWFWNCNDWLFSLRQVIRSHNEPKLGQAGIFGAKEKYAGSELNIRTEITQ